MAEITAALVKSLRETSGAGMLDCKKALVETNGNMEEAIDWLRKKGLASAAKKASRIAAEGLVSVYVEGNAGAVVEVNSETDFVAKNDIFQDYVENAAKAALAVKGDVEGLKAFTCPVTGKDMGTILTDMIASSAPTFITPFVRILVKSAFWLLLKAMPIRLKCRNWASTSLCTLLPPTRLR